MRKISHFLILLLTFVLAGSMSIIAFADEEVANEGEENGEIEVAYTEPQESEYAYISLALPPEWAGMEFTMSLQGADDSTVLFVTATADEEGNVQFQCDHSSSYIITPRDLENVPDPSDDVLKESDLGSDMYIQGEIEGGTTLTIDLGEKWAGSVFSCFTDESAFGECYVVNNDGQVVIYADSSDTYFVNCGLKSGRWVQVQETTESPTEEVQQTDSANGTNNEEASVSPVITDDEESKEPNISATAGETEPNGTFGETYEDTDNQQQSGFVFEWYYILLIAAVIAIILWLVLSRKNNKIDYDDDDDDDYYDDDEDDEYDDDDEEEYDDDEEDEYDDDEDEDEYDNEEDEYEDEDEYEEEDEYEDEYDEPDEQPRRRSRGRRR